eukprot:TRINITY_DN51915_c0_g1_i1.p1 TRINITY_DN51915_c0_g1~~TRINITY_DN51915_c0_g1_i1.p1  ORF type:complete len:591 (+),score=86.49 TRINITY_DN51915_c0_g1_i1:236-1774(+)
MAVIVGSVKDIQRTIRFSRRHDIRFLVHNSGHSFLGRSTAVDSIVIVPSLLSKFKFHTDSAGQQLVSTEAGADWGAVYAAVEERKLHIVGAWERTVGTSGGYIQGGGVSPTTSHYGFASDHVTEFEMVTVGGLVVKANERKNAHLFWALRGGGGGTFGVVTSVTYKLYPAPSSVVGMHVIVAGPAWSTFVTQATELVPSLAGRWGGYVMQGNTFISPHDGKVKMCHTHGCVAPSMIPEALQNTTTDSNGAEPTSIFFGVASFIHMAPWEQGLLDEFQAMLATAKASGPFATIVVSNFTSFLQWKGPTNLDIAGNPTWLVTSLVQKNAWEEPEKKANLMKTLVDFTSGAAANGVYLTGCTNAVTGGGAASHNSGAISSYMRSSYFSIVCSATYLGGSLNDTIEYVLEQGEIFNKLGQGNYCNEADYWELGWQISYWGLENYIALSLIKKLYDPTNQLRCWHCVGSNTITMQEVEKYVEHHKVPSSTWEMLSSTAETAEEKVHEELAKYQHLWQ